MTVFGAAISEARPRVVAALAARLRDLDGAEDAFSEAVAAALAAWPERPPRDPAAWLYSAALRRALDGVRRRAVRQRLAPEPPPPPPTPEDLVMEAEIPIPDERLRLIFVCCHPALAPEARVALALKIVCGLPVERLARAFLVAEPAMLQRITRAKRKIADAGIPFDIPDRAAWPERIGAVLATLEVAYAQAYEDAALASGAGAFAGEVLRLSSFLCELMPNEPEVLGLAALVRLAEARRPARLDDCGAMVPLEEQDPRAWRPGLIAEGLRLLNRAAGFGRTGPRQLLAAIHAAHMSRSETGFSPDGQILGFYEALLRLRPDPVVRVNHAVALAKVYGPDAGLQALAAIAEGERLQRFLPFHAARAGLLQRAGRWPEAYHAVAAALALSPAPAERLYLERKLREFAAASQGGLRLE